MFLLLCLCWWHLIDIFYASANVLAVCCKFNASGNFAESDETGDEEITYAETTFYKQDAAKMKVKEEEHVEENHVEENHVEYAPINIRR
ncbi:SLAM family member 9-like protein [Labeo rohita]|uniref:SLAM family member 9-like protein n=1 Tax=Labeo rohita TaxID=84645 RepID=A0A498MAM9_LABRO|nr:SLAM family member 9-like protein [Labeo rohita]